MPTGKVSREKTAVVKGFPLPGLQEHNLDIGIVKRPGQALRTEQDGPASRQDLRPTMPLIALFAVQLRDGRRRSPTRWNTGEPGTPTQRRDDGPVVAPAWRDHTGRIAQCHHRASSG